MGDLFHGSADAAAAEVGAPFVDFYNLYAVRKLGAPEGWAWVRLEALGKHPNYTGTLIEGAVSPKATKGKYIGHSLWSKRDRTTELKFAVTHEQLAAFKREWEVETGSCSHCYGKGQAWIGWSKDTGSKYEPCKRCGATGLAKVEVAA